MLRAFQDINADMERTGELVAAMAKGELLKMVARNNVMRTGILSSKIGLTKRFDARGDGDRASLRGPGGQGAAPAARRARYIACPWPAGARRRDRAAMGSAGGHLAPESLNTSIFRSVCAALLAGGGCGIAMRACGVSTGQAGSACRAMHALCMCIMQG